MDFLERLTSFESGIDSQTHFANRHSESRHFADARSFLNDYRATTAFNESIGADAPRRNVLSFYGMGGIGKSALLIELAARVRSEPDRGTTVVPIELHSANAPIRARSKSCACRRRTVTTTQRRSQVSPGARRK